MNETMSVIVITGKQWYRGDFVVVVSRYDLTVQLEHVVSRVAQLNGCFSAARQWLFEGSIGQ